LFYHLTYNYDIAISINQNGLIKKYINNGTNELDQKLQSLLGLNHTVVKARTMAIYLYFDQYLKFILEQIDPSAFVFYVQDQGLDFNKLFVMEQSFLNLVFDNIVVEQHEINYQLTKYADSFMSANEYINTKTEYKYPEYLYLDAISHNYVKLFRKPMQ
jgi:hypothetical protein